VHDFGFLNLFNIFEFLHSQTSYLYLLCKNVFKISF
jgi:hypothetical protein